MNPDVPLAVKHLTLEKLRVAAQYELGANVAAQATTDTWISEVTGNLVARLSSYVLADRVGNHTATSTEHVQFDSPATWFQHVKQALPTRNKWRPRLTTRTATVKLTAHWEQYNTFPKSSISLPALGGPVRLLQQSFDTSVLWDAADGDS